MHSLNELVAHSIECVHASMAIRKQGVMNSVHHAQPTTVAANGFTPVQNALLTLLKTATTPAGFSTTEITNQLKQFSENQVK